ncbi:MAG: hypothetical protein LBE76_02110 [Nitrososphaerota archaeon]|nr:hypothetical protein [Nitrososphaerota archaeon]
MLADEISQEIWNQIQNQIEQHGLKLDIVFEKSGFWTQENTVKSTAGIKNSK